MSLLELVGVIGRGRAAAKRIVANLHTLDAQALCYREDVLKLVQQAKADGRSVHLVTAADQSIADTVQSYLGCFDSVVGSDGSLNLKGRKKLAWLQKSFPQGYIYAGDSAADLPIWNAARGAILVGKGVAHANRLWDAGIPVELLHDQKTSRLQEWLKELRLHQWSKNVLIAVPLLLGHLTHDVNAILKTMLAFLAFGLVASATYILNDLADLEADRQHPTKRERPIAAGHISVAQGFSVALVLLGLGLGSSFALSRAFGSATAVYVMLTLAYSLYLKRTPMLDVTVIAALFTMRVFMGTVLHGLALSPWLLSFSGFFFLSLSLAKRHVELMRAKALGREAIHGRGYQVDDWPLTLGFGLSGALCAIVVMLMFVTEQGRDAVGYANPGWLFVAPICVFLWLTRIWMLSHRMELNDDPVIFALKDKISFVLGLAVLVAIMLAI